MWLSHRGCSQPSFRYPSLTLDMPFCERSSLVPCGILGPNAREGNVTERLGKQQSGVFLFYPL